MLRGSKRGVAASRTEFVKMREHVRTVNFSAPVVPGRSLIEGCSEPTFPPFFRAQVVPVTFRNPMRGLPRERMEEIYLSFVAKTLAAGQTMAVLVPCNVDLDHEGEPFWFGYTIIKHDEELYTFQRVVFLTSEAMPKGRCDQGSIFEVPIARMSAWNGLTSEESDRQAA